MCKDKLTEQTSVRMTADQRAFLQAQVRHHAELGQRVSEGDILRACIQYVMDDRGDIAMNLVGVDE